jgi:two-component system phosphate regulon sensor histidine kinase PhoR
MANTASNTKGATTTDADPVPREFRLIDGPVRWLYGLLGLLAIWVYRQGEFDGGILLGLSLYLLSNVASALILARSQRETYPYLAAALFVADLLYAGFLIYHTGGLVSQLYLLYCLLVFKAALYYPYIHSIILAPFLIFPLYVATLYLGSGTLVFLRDQMFVSRYLLLLIVIFAGLYTAWHLDSRHQQTRDLLERLEKEHQQLDQRRNELRAVLHSIADGVIVVDPDLQLMMINPRASDMFSLPYPPPPDVPLNQLIDQHELMDLLSRTLEAPDGQLSLVQEEFTAQPASSARPIVCQALATVLRAEGETVRGAVVVLRDMTRQKELEESKTNFLSVVSHELRTPLTAIRGFVELITTGDAGKITPKQREYLEIVDDQADHLGELINALLEFAELDSSEITLERNLVSVEELVHRAIGQFGPLADHREVRLEATIPPDLSSLYVDGHRVERVLSNLLDNAIKFTPAPGHVTLSVQEHATETQICVLDDGIGVPLAEQERVFERFYQVDGSSTREHGGTGLGLALCKHIVELHGGRIWVEQPEPSASAGGRPGSRFCFTLPRQPAGPAEAVPDAAPNG